MGQKIAKLQDTIFILWGYLLLAIVILAMTSCSALTKSVNRLSQETANAVEKYCTELDPEMRTIFRTKINKSLNGRATITVVCEKEEIF